jgi:predicted LPLAT superfamily acyltransferase
MPDWQGKSKGNPLLGYRIIFFVCTRLGVSTAYVLLRFVAFYYYLFSRRSSRNIYRYFRDRQNYGAIKSLLKTYRNYYVFAQSLLDKVIVMAGIENKFTYYFDGEQNLQDIAERRGGGILLSAHVGNWEAAGHLLSRLNTPINVVMFDGEYEGIKEFFEGITGRRNLNVITIKEDLSHIYIVGEALSRNELVCLHADRFMEGNKTMTREFLGSPAKFPEGPFALAAIYKVPVSMVFAFKETSRHYHFYGSEAIQREQYETKEDFVQRLMGVFVQHLEQKIKMYPEQWFNYYNFWE